MTVRSVIATTVSLVLLVSTQAAWAQKLVLGGAFGAASGVEGGDANSSSMQFRRARTQIFASIDGHLDEDAAPEAFALRLFAEVEPHAGLGAGARYLRVLSPRLTGFVGATSVLLPRTLVGADMGAQVHCPLSNNRSFFVEPTFAIMPLGTDLPGDHPLLWGLISVGFHAPL